MARMSLLSDDLVRQLMAVGQVDILVGVPTFNNAATVQSVVTTLHVGLAKHFPRERTVLLNADGGSNDGTAELARSAPMADAELAGSSTLRTTHRISARYSGLPGRGSGLRTVFAAADLLQARAVVVVDADVTSMTSDWVAEFARPIVRGDADLVLPVHPRSRFEGPLLSQLVRPLVGTAFGRRVHSNLAGDFGCSGRFAARTVPDALWNDEPSRAALDVWLVAAALAGDLRLTEAQLGPCVFAPRDAHTSLPEVFDQVVGATLGALERHETAWLPRTEARDLPSVGQPQAPGAEASLVNIDRLAERFRNGVRDLAPLLGEILAPETLARVQAAAIPTASPVGFPDALWVSMVYECAASAHAGIMNREHVTQAMVPLYLGRTAAFFSEIASMDEAAHSQRLAALEQEYERQRPYLVERWTAAARR